MKVRLRIDSMLLQAPAVAPHQAPAFRRALEAELAAQFGAGADFQPHHAARLRTSAPAFASSEPKRLGGEAARAIHGSVARHAL